MKKLMWILLLVSTSAFARGAKQYPLTGKIMGMGTSSEPGQKPNGKLVMRHRRVYAIDTATESLAVSICPGLLSALHIEPDTPQFTVGETINFRKDQNYVSLPMERGNGERRYCIISEEVK